VLVDQLRASGGLLSEIAPVRSTLEDVFVDLIKTDDPGASVAHPAEDRAAAAAAEGMR